MKTPFVDYSIRLKAWESKAQGIALGTQVISQTILKAESLVLITLISQAITGSLSVVFFQYYTIPYRQF